jgi:mono/diheme cytochrome c family protein
MNSKQLYSISALFQTADEIIHAAEETTRAGYTRFDVHTPYPVHGMDRAMRLKPTRLGMFALVFGLLGAFGGVGFMTWITLNDYPLVIGGKPFWSWPAFVPVAFEITVLLASVLSVVTMIVLYFKFPNTSHPLHDTSYMKKVSSDRFGISIQADDPDFDEKEVKGFLRQIGGEDIAAIYFPEEERSHWKTLLEPRFLGLLAVIAVVTSGATYFALNVLLYMEPFSWMSEQEKIIPQAPAAFFADGIGMRPPVEGTVARGTLPYPYHGRPEQAARYLVNPLVPTKEAYDRGKTQYLIHCSPCHGNFGAGDSRLQGQFPNPPTLSSDKLRTSSDGAIYHIITEGQNVMPPYGARISRDDRWAIVHYVRALQRAQNPEESDLQ